MNIVLEVLLLEEEEGHISRGGIGHKTLRVDPVLLQLIPFLKEFNKDLNLIKK